MTQRKHVKQDLPLGSHLSIAGGLPLVFDRAERVGCRVLQIFVKNNNRWKGRVLTDEEASAFRERWKAAKVRDIVAHSCYLINLAATDKAIWQRSIEALVDELTRCERLGLSFLVLHPGAHRGAGEGPAIRQIARALDRVHDRVGECRVRIALETTAGQGTSIGHRFEHLRDVIGACRRSERVFVCLDTCHVFAAGYDIRDQESYRKTMDEFDSVVGLNRLRIFHLNDSKKDLGSRVDRHEHIGKGHIGKDGFRWLLNDSRLAGLPKVLETPKGKEMKEDIRNLRLLRSLVDPPGPAKPGRSKD